MAVAFAVVQVATLKPAAGQVAAAPADGVEIVAVRRARLYGRGPGELRPSSDSEVILVMTVRGVPDREWNAGQIHLLAGQQRITVTRRVRFSGVSDRVMVFLVPSSATRFVLQIPGQVPVPFEATEPVRDHIMVR
jgi:hypothetical protein